MDCLQCMRLLHAGYGGRPYEQRAHLTTCLECARLMRKLEAFEMRIADAVLVPLPDALEYEIRLRCKPPGSWSYVAAALARAAARRLEKLFG
jgi:hypothetical protein